MSEFPDTPWGHGQREKLQILVGKQEAAKAEAPPEPTVATLTKKKSKKKKAG